MSYPSSQPFRFLDLPKELRLLIYKFLPNRIVRTKYVRSLDDGTVSYFTLISTFAPKAVLATCKVMKEEAQSTVRSIAERIVQSPMSEGIDIRLSGPGPRIEAHYKSLEFLAMPGGMVEGVTRWFQSLRQAHSDRSVPCFEAERYLPEDVLSSNGYTLENGTAAQGRLRALDFMRKAGWALYHLAQNCSLDEFRHVGCHPNLKGIFKMRGPMMQIALSQQDTDTANMYYAAVTEFADSIEELESTFGVGFLLHSLNTSGVSKKQSEEAWEASAFALSDKLHSGEMIQALHGFVIRGVFELDQAEKTAYRKYWCESE